MEDQVKILVVDDNPDILFTTSRIVKKAGYTALEATDGKACLSQIRQHLPDIVLLDVVLPDADGMDLTRQIKADPLLKDTFVVLLSGQKISSEDKIDGLDVGADGYITRPISNKELQAQITAFVRIKKTEQILREREEALEKYSERLEEMVEARTQELRDAQEQLVRRERLATMGQLAGSVAHELRNPLGVISNAVYFLEQTLLDADEQTQEYLAMIGSELHKSEKIIEDLLSFSRGRLAQSAERVDIAVSELVNQVLVDQPAPTTIDVSVEFDNDLPQVWVDPQQIQQVLTNLVSNAYQAMPDGGKLTISAQADGDSVVISVSDNGVGIPVENLDKLFEPLFTTKPKGIGLGLVVSRNLVEANGGCLTVESTKGRGSQFIITLPIQEKKE
jgi:signal transduction histidine kinase